jgi:formamidopyrimidine-DNA glycosylase
MPELPEVATMVKAFKPHIMGRHVRHVLAEASGLLEGASLEDLRRALEHTVVCGVYRHGKYVRIDFDPPPDGIQDRAIARPPATATSVVARRPDTLEELLSGKPGKSGQSGPSTGKSARALFEATRLRPHRKSKARASLIFHLKMTGRFYVMNDNGHPVPPRTRFLMAMEDEDDDMLFGIKDTRRLARVWLLSHEDAHRWPEWLELGPDALTGRITDKKLARTLEGELPIKLALVDQSRLAGLGNIYASEVLHRTRIHPERMARDLTTGEWKALAREIPRLLRKSMEEWCNLSRWVGPAVEGYGDFNGSLMVYDREGENCRRCGEPILTIKQGGRTTYFCKTCQK